MASTTTVFAPLPSISLSDKMHKTDRASTVHAGIMWQRAAKHFLSSASALGGGGGVGGRVAVVAIGMSFFTLFFQINSKRSGKRVLKSKLARAPMIKRISTFLLNIHVESCIP